MLKMTTVHKKKKTLPIYFKQHTQKRRYLKISLDHTFKNVDYFKPNTPSL